MILTEQNEMICENLSRNESGELCFAGMPLSPLAEQYGTPLYLYDEARIRERCRTYRAAMQNAFGSRGRVLYASKAASFRRLYEIMREEEMLRSSWLCKAAQVGSLENDLLCCLTHI